MLLHVQSVHHPIEWHAVPFGTAAARCRAIIVRMGMSTHVVGFRPPDEKWRKMKAVWDACKAAETDPPVEVEDFFGGDEPDEAGVEVRLDPLLLDDNKAKLGVVVDWEDDMREGLEVDLEKLRANFPSVTKLRFYNSY